MSRTAHDTKYLQRLPDTVRKILRERIIKTWWSIKGEILEGLLDSMSRRVQAVIDADCWYTK